MPINLPTNSYIGMCMLLEDGRGISTKFKREMNNSTSHHQLRIEWLRTFISVDAYSHLPHCELGIGAWHE